MPTDTDDTACALLFQCYASVEEIRAVSAALLRRVLPALPVVAAKKVEETLTFKVDVKRRLCSHLTRDDVIGAVTPALVPDGGRAGPLGRAFAVDLSAPDVCVRVEVVKSLCGISVLPGGDDDFNIAKRTTPSSERA